jgi:hypothetical protein
MVPFLILSDAQNGTAGYAKSIPNVPNELMPYGEVFLFVTISNVPGNGTCSGWEWRKSVSSRQHRQACYPPMFAPLIAEDL